MKCSKHESTRTRSATACAGVCWLLAVNCILAQSSNPQQTEPVILPPLRISSADPLHASSQEQKKDEVGYPKLEKPGADRYPIDLPTALRLAGASNLQIALASERVQEAQARLAGARAAWLPSLSAGIGYNKHDGQIQDTRGQVIEVSRGSFFVGGGPALGGSALTGATGGPARLVVDFSLADGLFAPLVERQLVRASDSARTATFNDTLLQVAIAYLGLARAQGQAAIAKATEKNADELVRLIDARIKAGKAPPADGFRVQAESALRRREVLQAEEAVRVASAELVRLLRLDPATVLFPQEDQVAPLAFVEETVPLADLIAQALASRPEVEVQQAVADAAANRLQQEKWRPLIPHVHVGLSAGGFGGGPGSFVGNFSDRADFDALLVWQLRNLGLGNRALRRERESQNQQAMLLSAQVRDFIAAEVVSVHAQVELRRKQLEAARTRVEAASQAVPLNFKGILGDVLRAIEAQQAIQTLAAAQSEYLEAITAYNRSQFLLVRALGKPIDR
ncbi:MAG: TolC family protein [Gemmataceae bacterium]|nr:TolC family protein [Gemmataceae bacterium]MCI0742456.1 TolC family protein [Gemmataceae bacterium]